MMVKREASPAEGGNPPLEGTAQRVAFDAWYYYFEAAFAVRPSEADLRRAQIDLGYHPAGYGPILAQNVRQQGDRFWAEWKISNDCE